MLYKVKFFSHISGEEYSKHGAEQLVKLLNKTFGEGSAEIAFEEKPQGKIK